MISIIICSVNIGRAKALEQNIAKTIGIPFEVIIWDNRQYGYGLAKVYNICAFKAKYDFLCFVHEDIKFDSDGWGIGLIEQLRKPDCGVIGFAGSVIKSRNLSGWGQDKKYNLCNYIQCDFERGGEATICCNIDKTHVFVPCITLDGLVMFVRKSVWAEFLFDEKLLNGFHGYDLDFSMNVSRKYLNYVCNMIQIEHLSLGNFGVDWLNAMHLLHRKWEKHLPIYIGEISLEEVRKNESEAYYNCIKSLFRSHCSQSKVWLCIKDYIKKYHFREHSLTLLLKYISRLIFK